MNQQQQNPGQGQEQEQQIALDLSDFAQRVADGHIVVDVLKDGSTVVSAKRYSERTGEEVKPPQLLPITVEALEENKTRIQQETAQRISMIDEVIRVIKAETNSGGEAEEEKPVIQ